ncbi:hypothetical protein ACFC3F_12575 [Microbacterium sp. NPDC055910]|uniref:hypothetical protein n=1 Tax=Microbacterium sp. NPDC055910 TaxID=3345659 RepID=UPI0035DD35B4
MSLHQEQGSTSFDPRPLVEPVDRADVRAFTQRLRATGALRGSGIGNVIGVVVLIAVAIMILISVSTAATAFLTAAVSGTAPPWFVAIGATIFILFVLGILAAVITAVVRAVGGGAPTRRFRLDRFAQANGMGYLPTLANPRLPGMIFGLGSSRQSLDLVRGTRPRFVEFANYRYTTGSGKNRTTHSWGYVAVKLDVPLPHIVLDALGNNGLFGSNLPTSFDRDQRLSLEGDFDRYFSLYCPTGYERDALYLFTPDIMARFIDNAAALDVEIVDDWLFLYAKRDFSTLDPATWSWLFSVVGALLDKLAQWERWRDDRLTAPATAHEGLPFAAPSTALRPPPGVAAPGRRLKRGIPWAVVIVVGIMLLMWSLPQIMGFVWSVLGR